MKKSQEQQQQISEPKRYTPPGALLESGSWDFDAEFHDRGELHRFVEALINQRRLGSLTPVQAASAVAAAGFRHAFPNHRQWESTQSWPLTWTSTSAEEAVKREGRGADGHWCIGDRWQKGPEFDCSRPEHRSIPKGAEVRSIIAGITERLAAVESGPASSLATMLRAKQRETRLTEEQVAEAHRQAAEIRAREVGQ